MRVLEGVKVEGIHIQFQTRWMDKKNWCSKQIFKVMGEMKRSSVILALNKLDGTFTMTTKKLEKLCCVYCNELYDDVPINLKIKRLKEKNHNGRPQKVQPFH